MHADAMLRAISLCNKADCFLLEILEISAIWRSQAPPDLLRTVAGGSALFDATSSAAELGLEKYRSIEDAFREAVEYIRSGGA